MNVEITDNVFKQISKFPQKIQTRIFKKLDELKDDKAKYSKLSGNRKPPLWKLKIGDYRVLFEIDKTITAITHRAGHRKNVYKDL